MAKSDINTAENEVKSNISSNTNNAAQNLNPASDLYKNFAATGGVSPQQQQLTQKAAQGNVSSLYDSLNKNLQQRNAIQGGYSPGFGANEQQLARQGASASSGAVNQANLGLDQLIQQGKLAGAGGLASIGSLYQGQIPQLLGTQSQLAEAKPSWEQELSGGLGAIGGLAAPFAQAFGGASTAGKFLGGI